MKEVTINTPNEVLKVNIGENSFSIPLGSSLPFDDVLELSKAKGSDRLNFLYKFLKDNIPEDIYKTLSMGDVTQIFNAWSEATKEATGATPGES